MKIMTIITGMRSGGAERVMATLCNELSKRHQVRLLIMKENILDYELSNNVEVLAGNVKNQSLVQSVKFVCGNIDGWKPDVSLAFMTKSNIIALLANKFANNKCRMVIAERANPFYAKGVFKFIRRLLYPMADGCVFQTKQAQAYYKNILKCDSIILKNPLNPDFKVQPYSGIRKKKIVCMGRLSVEKNHKLLIQAFSKIAEKYPEYLVEIYGDGPLHQELDEIIKQMGLKNRVILIGRKNNVQQYIADAEIFVLPSNSEGMPNALLEAMALGLSCISTDCPAGGPAIIISNNENGILVPMDDSDKMAEAIEKLIVDGNFAEKLRRNACRIIQDYGTEKVCSEWESYLQAIAD